MTAVATNATDTLTSSPASWPALCRPSTPLSASTTQVVDGRAKPGHDEGTGARTYRSLAALLCYPTPDLQAAATEIAPVLEAENLLTATQRDALAPLLHDLHHNNIYDLQERYVDLFDRGRAVSLHLFEHVHGESRDRGQAMADLIALYAQHGLEMTESELPDFLPLFLEFLSLLPTTEAQALLAEPAAILRVLADRLAKRDAGYAAVLEVLAALAEAPQTGASAIPDEDPNDLEALDATWE